MNAIPTTPPDAIFGERIGDYGGLRLLISDVRVVGALLKEARYQSVARLFGASKEDSALVTIVALGTLAYAGQRKVAKLSAYQPTDLGDTVLAAAGLRQLVAGVAGAPSIDIPGFGALIVLTVVATSIRPVTRRSWHAVRTASHAARLGFDSRYGHILRPHLRSQ